LSVSPGPVQRILDYLRTFDGGNCFYLAPLAISENSARIEGFGTSATPFEGLDQDFKRKNGFEADIGVRLVTAAQCPALAFLKQMSAIGETTPHLEIESYSLHSGQSLLGMVSNYGSRAISLLLVSDDGSVRNVSGDLKADSDAKTFELQLQRATGRGAQPQLLLAVATGRPLVSLSTDKPVPANVFFPAVFKEIQSDETRPTVAAKYFKLD
jgi:hypothetical protein